MADLNFFSPAQIGQNLESVCRKKCHVPFGRLIILSILAGAYIAFGAQLYIMVVHDVSSQISVGVAKFLGGSVFSVGLMLVIIAGAELFTGDNLIAISLMKGSVKWSDLFKTWTVVYVGNFVGSIILVLIMYYSGLWKTDHNMVGATALNIANAKVHLSFVEALMRGIACNWLVCLAVWMAASAKDVIGKIFAIYFPIMAFVASGFEHSVANMFFIPYGIFLKGNSNIIAATGKNAAAFTNLNWGSFLYNNLLPVTIGNIIGGSLFVGVLYWYIYLKNSDTDTKFKIH